MKALLEHRYWNYERCLAAALGDLKPARVDSKAKPFELLYCIIAHQQVRNRLVDLTKHDCHPKQKAIKCKWKRKPLVYRVSNNVSSMFIVLLSDICQCDV